MALDKITLQRGGRKFEIDLAGATDISLPIERTSPQRCFGLGFPEFKAWRDADFTGSIAMGGSCNVEVITLIPHGHGTHTETSAHIVEAPIIRTNSHPIPPLMLAMLVSAIPAPDAENERVIGPELWATFTPDMALQPEVAILRTLPNTDEKKSRDYTGTNPPYLSPELCRRLRISGFRHLIVDLPSVDKEVDTQLLAHHAFLSPAETQQGVQTITELVYVPDHFKDGLCAVSLQPAPIGSDATPSRVILYPAAEITA